MADFKPLASWNGEVVPLHELRIPATDRGFFFGDGVYEVIRLYQGQPFLLEEHLSRLAYSLEQVRILHPLEPLKKNLNQLLSLGPRTDGLAYIQVTRGAALRNHLFPLDTTPNQLLYIAELSDPQAKFRASGISVILADDSRWHRPDIKSLNLLPNVLIRQHAADCGAQEAILKRWDDRITEATSSNVFIVKNNSVITPKNDHWILNGISRRFIAKLCREHRIDFQEEEIRQAELENADEVFLSSTTCEVIGVSRVGSVQIGDGKPGAVTARLYKLFRHSIDQWIKGSKDRHRL